jgi:hypothetical protein
MSENGGIVRWWQLLTAFLTLFGITVTLFIWGANCVIASDIRSVQRAVDVKSEFMEFVKQYIIPMREDIAVIKNELSKK